MTNCGEIYLTLPSASEPPCAECEFRKLIEEKRGAKKKEERTTNGKLNDKLNLSYAGILEHQ